MVLRMLMRWAERRGFRVELLEVSPGEEAGIKSATFRAGGENAYGLFGAERGVHRLVRLSPFDSAHRRQTSFAGVEVAPSWRTAARSRSTRTTCRWTPTAPRAPGASTSTRPTRRCGSPTAPTGIVVQCQNERSQSSNRATAMAMLRAKLLERQERERQQEIAREKGEAQDVNFGSQIRSYVLHPYTMVKDHRTDEEVGRRPAGARRRPRRLRARAAARSGPPPGNRRWRGRAGPRRARAERAHGGHRRRRRDHARDGPAARARAGADHPEAARGDLRPAPGGAGLRAARPRRRDRPARCRRGSGASTGEAVLRLRGSARALLTGERTALNFLAHLSGVATRRRTGRARARRAPRRRCSTRARPPPGCARWRRTRCGRAARTTTAPGCTTRS